MKMKQNLMEFQYFRSVGMLKQSVFGAWIQHAENAWKQMVFVTSGDAALEKNIFESKRFFQSKRFFSIKKIFFNQKFLSFSRNL